MTRRLAISMTGLFLALAALGGCARHRTVSYAPAAYGMQVGNVYECYYVDNPAEVQALIARGLCPVGAVPTRMPESYLDEYFPYYDSPAYYNTYVPVAYRTGYISTYHAYYLQHVTVINAASRSASWKRSDGKTVSGSQVDTAKMDSTGGDRGGSSHSKPGTGSHTKSGGTSGGSLHGGHR